MDATIILPRSELRPYVRAYLQRRTYPQEAVAIEISTMRLEQFLRFEFRNTAKLTRNNGAQSECYEIGVFGPSTSTSECIHVPPDNESFIVLFQPAGFSQLFKLPVRELTDQVHEGRSVLGEQVRSLRDQMGEAPSFQQRVKIFEDFLWSRMNSGSGANAIHVAANYVLRRHGTIAIASLAARCGLSLRQFERRFVAEVGLTPKRWTRIARMQAALDTKVAFPHRSWLEIAHALGYHDQMHMVHDFDGLAGDSPSRLVAQLGNMFRGWIQDAARQGWTVGQ